MVLLNWINRRPTSRRSANSFISRRRRPISLSTENTVYPYLYPSDFPPGIVDRVRNMIKINRADHPWNELSDNDFFNASGLYRRDLTTGKEGFTLAAFAPFW